MYGRMLVDTVMLTMSVQRCASQQRLDSDVELPPALPWAAVLVCWMWGRCCQRFFLSFHILFLPTMVVIDGSCTGLACLTILQPCHPQQPCVGAIWHLQQPVLSRACVCVVDWWASQMVDGDCRSFGSNKLTSLAADLFITNYNLIRA